MNHKNKQAEVEEMNREFTAIGRRILEARGFTELSLSYENPDNNPDLPFLWRAMEWAKDGGVISLAMPARLFGRTTGIGFDAWRAILQSVQVTGLINGADLRKTAVWDGIDMPFCLFFARNAKPNAEHRFHYSAPSYEPGLNGEGRFRIDYEAAQPISISRVAKQPWLLKTLSLGTWLDVEVMERLNESSTKTFKTFWKDWDIKSDKMGQGYKTSFSMPQSKDEFLADYLDFVPDGDEFRIPWSVLKTYEENHGTKQAAAPRREALYQPLLVIIPKAPGELAEMPKAYIADRKLAFSQSYYGYSCKGHPEAATLVSFIYLLAHSTLFRYFSLMTSVSQGADHMIFTKQDFDSLPFPNFDNLTTATKADIRSLAQRLESDAKKPWQEIDTFLFRLYGLDSDAVQVATDTLFAASAYRNAGRSALELTTRDHRTTFITYLREVLAPYFDVCDEYLDVREADFQPDNWDEPWFFLAVSRVDNAVKINPSLMREAMKQANQRGCSRIIVHAPKKQGLLLGLLNQRRWWTITRARLCAQHVIREHLDAFGLKEDE